MRTNVSSDQKAKIVNQYWIGTPVKDLCEKYQVPRSTLYSWPKPYQNVYASQHATEAIATQKEYNTLKRKYERQQQVLKAIADSGCITMIPLEERIVIFDQLSERYGANILLDALSISKGSYYNLIKKNRVSTYYKSRHDELSDMVRRVFDESDQCYGSDKILAVLQAQGVRTSKKYILRLMHEMGLVSVTQDAKKNYKALTKKKNIVKRQFEVSCPNEVWVSDCTQYMVKGIYYYICAIIDLFSRRVIAYKISPNCTTRLITATFKIAYEDRGRPQDLIFHSDQGTQYTSNAFRRLLADLNVRQSFSRPGMPNDNAVCEAFFAILEKEELYRKDYRSERDFRQGVGNFIIKYNTERPHRFNKNQPPIKVEDAYWEALLDKSKLFFSNLTFFPFSLFFSSKFAFSDLDMVQDVKMPGSLAVLDFSA